MAASITSRDVAHAAGVSQSTVSYVLSGKRFVAPDTEAKVLAAMDELGYRPHVSARALRSRRSGVIGLVVPYHEYTDTANQYRYIVSVASACRNHDYELLMASSDEGPEGMKRLIDSAQCDGLIIMDVKDDDSRIDVARSCDIPCVFIGFSADMHEVTAIDTDFEAIATRSVTLMAQRHHRDIVVINSSSEHVTPMGFTRRFNDAIIATASDSACTILTTKVARGLTPMREAIATSLTTHPQVRAFITGPTLCADDAANALVALGFTPGQDVSLIAAAQPADSPHTDIDYAFFSPDVPTVAGQAVSLLLDKLSLPAHQPSAHMRTIPPTFHEGHSLMPLPQSAPSHATTA